MIAVQPFILRAIDVYLWSNETARTHTAQAAKYSALRKSLWHALIAAAPRLRATIISGNSNFAFMCVATPFGVRPLLYRVKWTGLSLFVWIDVVEKKSVTGKIGTRAVIAGNALFARGCGWNSK